MFFSWVGWLQKKEKVEKRKKSLKRKEKKKLCHCSPILAIRPLTRSFYDLRKKVFRDVTDRQTNKQTDGHSDSMTELAQWADSVKRPLLKF